MRKILVYGAGAVGLAYTSALVQAKQDVTLYAKGATHQEIFANGISRIGILGDVHCSVDQFRLINEIDPSDKGLYDIILVCTKVSDIEHVVGQLEKVINHDTYLVLFHNGLDINRFYEKISPKDKIFNAYIYTGFKRPKRNVSEVTAHGGDTLIGNLERLNNDDPVILNLCDCLKEGGIGCSCTDDISKSLWSKMLYNCTMNSLSFLMKVNNGELAQIPEMRQTIEDVIDEIYCVGEKMGKSFNWPTADEYKNFLFNTLIPLSASHKSSMLQDMENNQKTEIDFLNGSIVRYAKAHGVPCPVNQTLLNMVKFTEQSYLA